MKAARLRQLLPISCIAVATFLSLGVNAHAQSDSEQVDSRVESILSKMTLEEKLDYIGGGYPTSSNIISGVFNIKAIPRLGLPWITMVNGPLGIQTLSGAPSTRYPAGLTVAATWNTSRAFGRGRQMGRDARARGYHVDLGPGIDPYRTALGGRNFEYNTGEDPFLGGQLTVPFVLAFQKQGVWANIKHYAANEEEYRREAIDIQVDERTLREIYLPPFEAAVKQGRAASVMGALNSVNGSFACENYYLDTQVLKKDWAFNGVLLSDYQGIHDGIKAANAGMDLDMPFSDFMNPQTLLPAIQSGQVSIATIDDKVRRILRKIISFGFLDRPQLDTSIPLDDPKSSLEALNEAREGIVLLKNANGLLPFDRNRIHSVAVLGRLAPGVPPTGFGSSYLNPIRSVSELEGIQTVAGSNVKVDFINNGTADPSNAVWQFVSNGGASQPGLQGEYFTSNDLSGSPVATRIDPEVDLDWTQPGTIPAQIPTTNQATFSVRWTGQVHPQYSGDHLFKVRADGGVRVYVNGQLLIDNFLSPTPPPVYGTTIPVYAKVALTAGQTYNVTLEYRRVSGYAGGSGSWLGVQFSWTPLVVPATLAGYDAVVLSQGIDNEYDGEGLDLAFQFENQGLAGLERAIIMPEFQDELIQ
ncbi:MAG: glycoside hydrolase family 3 C-terminal domain-containing protein, partial [Verrucomicrobia bacterium]|nr:glycoside hydrolase family 3 C-terminal domain-containing protein [Verrucomicrobiota bacterium]